MKDSQEERKTRQAAEHSLRIGALFTLSDPGSVVGVKAMRDATLIDAEKINARAAF